MQLETGCCYRLSHVTQATIRQLKCNDQPPDNRLVTWTSLQQQPVRVLGANRSPAPLWSSTTVRIGYRVTEYNDLPGVVIGLTKIKIETSKRHTKYCRMHIGCSDISDITMGIEKSNHQILYKKISVIIAKQAGARHFWLLLSTNFLFCRIVKEGRKIGEFREKKCSKTTLHPMEPGVCISFMDKPILGTKACDWSTGYVDRV